MGGPYQIPRNVKGEGRILFVFSTKALIYTSAGGLIGVLLYYLFKSLGLSAVGIFFLIVFAGAGFIIATFKMPDIARFEITRKTGGEAIDDVIRRAIKFKRNKKKIYVFKEEVNRNGEQ